MSVPYMSSADSIGRNISKSYATTIDVIHSDATRSTTTLFEDTDKDGGAVNNSEELLGQMEIENKIREGAENMLQIIDSKLSSKKSNKLYHTQPSNINREKVESQLNAAKQKIAALQFQVEKVQKAENNGTVPTKKSPKRKNDVGALPFRKKGPPGLFFNPSFKFGDYDEMSPTFSFSELIQSLESPMLTQQSATTPYYILKVNELVNLFQAVPKIKYDIDWHTFSPRVIALLLSSDKDVVAAGFRLARYSISDKFSIQALQDLDLDYFLIRSLSQEGKAYSLQREQAIKFIREIMDSSDVSFELSLGLMRAIICISETQDDSLRHVALETVAEMTIINPELVVKADGIRSLVYALTNGPPELSDTLAGALIYLLDLPATRGFLRPGLDLDSILSPFTEVAQLSAEREMQLASCSKVIIAMLKSWSGIILMCMNDMLPLRSLVNTLHLNSSSSIVRDSVLDLIFDVLDIKSREWSSAFMAGQRLTIYGRNHNANMASKDSQDQKPKPEECKRLNMFHAFTAILLAAFLQVGVLDALGSVIATNDPKSSRKATLLMEEILQLTSKYLPRSYSQRLQTLPKLFNLAASFGDEYQYTATTALLEIDRLSRARHRNFSTPTLQKPSRNSVAESAEKRSKRQVEQVKMKIGLQIDDNQFRTMLIDTQVISTKNSQKWKWDIINELIQGPLLNPKRLDEALKATKFMKRLLSYYRPYKYRFSNVKNTKPNQRYVKIGCSLFSTLLANVEGIKFLSEDKVLRQVAEGLSHLLHDGSEKSEMSETVFAPQRLADTLCGGYFKLLGVLSKQREGLDMLERWRIFSLFYSIIELEDRFDVTMAFIEDMDYVLDGHPRVIISKALTTGPRVVRLFATKHLGSLIRKMKVSKNTIEWAIKLLVIQLYDPDIEVCEAAISVLEEACQLRENLELVVQLRPTLDHLGEISNPLLLRFLATSVGFSYLTELEYIEREMDDWFHGRNENYVIALEGRLAQTYHKVEITEDSLAFDGSVPPHFYGELARTDEGCKMLDERGHLLTFYSFLDDNGLEDEDAEVIHKVKSFLWAIVSKNYKTWLTI